MWKQVRYFTIISINYPFLVFWSRNNGLDDNNFLRTYVFMLSAAGTTLLLITAFVKL